MNVIIILAPRGAQVPKQRQDLARGGKGLLGAQAEEVHLGHDEERGGLARAVRAAAAQVQGLRRGPEGLAQRLDAQVRLGRGAEGGRLGGPVLGPPREGERGRCEAHLILDVLAALLRSGDGLQQSARALLICISLSLYIYIYMCICIVYM